MSKDRSKLNKQIQEETNDFYETRSNRKSGITKTEFDKIPIELNPKQDILYKGIKNNILSIVHGPAGTGKAQPLTSDILTPNGWTKMGDIKEGDYVIGDDGKAIKVLGVFPQGDREIFEVIMDDGSKTECCDEHLWFTQTVNDRFNRKRIGDKRIPNAKEGSVKQLSEIRKSLFKDDRLNHYIPVVKPVEFESIPVKIDSYILGLLLGDGCIREKLAPTITTSDDEIITFVESYVRELKLDSTLNNEFVDINLRKFVDKRNPNVTTLSLSSKRGLKNGFASILNEYKLDKKSYEKFIPKDYLFNDVESRISLLQGLMDTDGYINKSSLCYTTTSVELKNDFCKLINSLGGTNKVSKKIPSYEYKGEKMNGLEAYNITFKLPKGIEPFKLSRKLTKYNEIREKSKYQPIRRIKEVNSIGEKECQCIMVDSKSHLYVTDNYIVTHNTWVACYTALALLANKKIDKIVLTKPIQESGEQLGHLPGTQDEKVEPFMRSYISTFEKMIGKQNTGFMISTEEIIVEPLAYMRGRTFDYSVMLLDECQNATMKQLMLWSTRLGRDSKAIMMGDTSQFDIRKNQTGYMDFIQMTKDMKDLYNFEFANEDIVRNKFLIDLTNRYDQHRANDDQKRTDRREN